MSVRLAHRIRRGAFGLSALVATLAAHVLVVGPIGVSPRTLLIAGLWLVLTTMLPSPRAFAARGVAATALLLVLAQFSCHAALVAAPDLFGLTVHVHEGPPITIAAAVVHLVVALHLGLLLAGADRILEAATAVARRVRVLFSHRRPGIVGPIRFWPIVVDGPRSDRDGPVHPGRGPPRVVSV